MFPKSSSSFINTTMLRRLLLTRQRLWQPCSDQLSLSLQSRLYPRDYYSTKRPRSTVPSAFVVESQQKRFFAVSLGRTVDHDHDDLAETLASLRALSSSSSASSSADPVEDDVHYVNVSPTVTVSKEDEDKEETQRLRISEVPISEVLKSKHAYRWVDPVIRQNATIKEAIVTAIDGGLSGMMVLEDPLATPANSDPVVKRRKSRIVGLLTTRDLLRIMAKGIKEGESGNEIMNRVVADYMTPVSQVVYGRPDETVGMARTLMAKLRIKTLPILSKDGQVEGLITTRDMSDFGLSAKERGGKRAYLEDVSERVGLKNDTSMAEPPTYLKAHLALEQKPLYVNIGVAALPHPYKTAYGMAESRRDQNTRITTDDTSLSEDAHFVRTVVLPDEQNKALRAFTYVGVADGVGSWREYGVDPRHFARGMMQESENILIEAARHEKEKGDKVQHVIAPAKIMAQAYDRVKAKSVVGSTTACIGLFDGLRHQFHFSNLGDSGLIVLRHIDSDVAGSLKRERRIPRVERKSDMQVAFVSQQQLRSFNHPYQLGWTGDEESNAQAVSFKSARDSCTSSVHLRRGDIVIMATDGLFDNVELDEIRAMAIDWEQKHGLVRGGDIAQRERRWAMGNSLTIQSNEHISELAKALVDKARENSLNSEIDSPFAILAKENDIMWSGGMPDDVTVLAMHVVGKDPEDIMDTIGK